MKIDPAQDAYKIAGILAEPSYPPVSAWEFDALKTEPAFQARLKSSTLYMIAQRPLLWFDQVRISSHEITFEITDGRSAGVPCRIDPSRVGLVPDGGSIDVEVGFHRDARHDVQPLRNVAAIRLYDPEDGFLVWWSPQKLIYEHVVRGLRVDIGPGIEKFFDFKVHYIGKAFDQTVWDRLRKHEKYNQILIREDVQGQGHAKPSLEVTLITLQVYGLDEKMYLAGLDQVGEHAPSVVHSFGCGDDDPRRLAFASPWVQPGDAAVTTELEAMLINLYQPRYNTIKFKAYPAIKGGLRVSASRTPS